jgi:hypothetical protein
MTDRWLRLFARHVPSSPSFLREMSAQLAAPFSTRTGLALADFNLGPEGPQMFVVEGKGLVRFVRASLVGSRIGFPITIAWDDPQQRGAVLPTADVAAGEVRFWWHELPADEIRAAESAPLVAPFDLARFSFVTRFAVKIWPHIRITVTLRRELAPDDLDRIARDFVAVQDTWNGSPGRGTVHRIGTARQLDTRRASFDVDLGSAAPLALEPLLDALERAGDVAEVEIAS